MKQHTHKELFLSAVNYIRQARTILCASPRAPDGDSVGCLLAFRHFLVREGKKVTLWAPDALRMTPLMESMPGVHDIATKLPETPYDLVFAFDYGNLDRLELPQRVLQETLLIGFDHHSGGNFSPPYGFAINNPRFQSTTLLLFEFFRATRQSITKEMAHCLLVGACTDTRFLRTPAATPHTLRAIDALQKCGASLQVVSDLMVPQYSLKTITAWQKALERLETYGDVGILVNARHNLHDHISYSDISGLLDALFVHVQDLSLFAFITQQDNGWYVSLRSPNKSKDVVAIAEDLGGGGRTGAAAFTSTLPIEDIKENLFAVSP
jgi:nanoRNase/pAp phosphatase (c-di-AMP/oligoRNAs hydrolase)